jgi:5-methyltetrahydrofolate--homocysteine methyltransferase
MATIVSSPNLEVKIGSEYPFVIIGERINPTGRKLLAAEMASGNFDRVRSDAIAQVSAGAHMLDVNAGIPLADEPAILAQAIQVVQSVTDVPLSIDSSIIAALERGLEVYRGKPLVNSVTAEEERLEKVLPLVARYRAAVVGVANDETGISEDPDVRFAIAKKIVERAQDHGIPREDVIIDPLAMPIGAVPLAIVTLFKIVRRLREELGVNSICGASNISFGLPSRPTLNATFLAMAIGAGMTCAITNPLEEAIRNGILAANVMMGHDENCKAWLSAHRAGGDDTGSERAARRERRRLRTSVSDVSSQSQ